MNERVKKPNRLAREMLELATDMKLAGLLDTAAYDTIASRHSDVQQAPITPIAPADVKSMRAKAGMTQAIFAQHLNLSTTYISELERGGKSAAGAALVLLDIVRRKGIEAIL